MSSVRPLLTSRKHKPCRVHMRWALAAGRGRGVVWMVCGLAIAGGAVARADGQTQTIRVDLKLRTGGALSGAVLDHTEHGLVVVHEQTPYVFAWEELEGVNACQTKRALLVFDRGGEDRLTAEDYFQLGLFMLAQDRHDLAAREFGRAQDLDPTFGTATRKATSAHRARQQAWRREQTVPPLDDGAVFEAHESDGDVTGLDERIRRAGAGSGEATVASGPLANRRQQVLQVYRAFGEKVQDVLGPGVVLVETNHFLIWTDWGQRRRDKLAEWCEATYAALVGHFGLDPEEDVFLAKCPVFCWTSAARFRKFARQFDGYDGKNAVGYTRSIQENGHVHVVLLRQGHEEKDFDRFASTLVHEATHAFLHRLYSTRLIPHWINEGYADMIAERVLVDRCPNAENAELLARQFVRYGWPIGELLLSTGPIEVQQYPIAHSTVGFLSSLDERALAGVIRALKAGSNVPEALVAEFDGLTLDALESRWRAAVRERDASWHAAQREAAALPWATGR